MNSRLKPFDNCKKENIMSNWNFEDMGDFADDAAAERWAKRNDIDLRDIRTSASGKGVRLRCADPRSATAVRRQICATAAGRDGNW